MKVKYKLFKPKTTPFGGLYVFTEFLHQISFHNTFNQIFGKLRKSRSYTVSQNISLLMAMLIEGGERLYDINRFTNDQTICQLFDVPSIPEDTTLRDDMELLGQYDQKRAEIFLFVNETLFDKLNITSLTIDIDGTALPVDGHQEGAEKGYCAVEPGSRCFQSVIAVCDETETIIAEKTMSGECHCSKDRIEFIKPWLDRLSAKYHKIQLRLDAGFYSEELLLFLESYHNVKYKIGVPQHQWLKEKVQQCAYKSYFNSNRQYTDFAYGEGLNGAYRYYYVERSKKQTSQMELFDNEQFNYRVVVSNEERQPQIIFNSYNKRARIEKHIEELKNQYGLGKMISGTFLVTKVLCWVSHLTFTIMGMLRQIAFRKDMKKYRLKRLRFILFVAEGYFVEHARKTIFYLGLARVGPIRFESIMQRIWAF